MWIYKTFENICNEKDRDKRVELLKEHANDYTIRTILKLAYNDKVKLAIPEGKPPFLSLPKAEDFKTNVTPNEYAQIIRAIGQCVKSNKTTQFEKENVFIQILSKIHPEDALLLIACKDEKLVSFKRKKYSKMTKSLVQSAIPDIL